MDIIVYHNACPDGFTAAYIAKLRYPEAKLMPKDHGLEPPYEELKGKEVLVVDFSWKTREQNDRIAADAKSLLILDHHKTAQAVLDGAPYAVFDMERSGAGLTWDYLFGKDSPDACYDQGTNFEPRPWFINYVEDRDLWKFVLPKSREVSSYIMTFAHEIRAWDKMAATDIRVAMDAGEAIQLQVEHYVREVIKQAQPGTLNILDKHFTVGVVNVPYLNTSEVGDALARRYDIGLGWFERSDGLIQFSARSHNTGDVDVSAIAKTFGGGGHTHAAGWQLSLDKGRELVDTILGRNTIDVPEGIFGAY